MEQQQRLKHDVAGSRLRSEQGQALVLTMVMLGVMIGMAALAIDLSGWLKSHHQDQVTADSAALAAANCLGNPNTGATVNCTSSHDVGTATIAATTVASINNTPVPASNITVDTAAGTVTVVAPSTGTVIFGKALGLASPAISARAVARFVGTDCSSSGIACDLIFAMDSTCNDAGVTINASGSKNDFSGGVHSNSGYVQTASGGSHPSFGTVTYGNGTTPTPCSDSTSKGANYTSGPTAENTSSTWPIDYAQEYPACSATATSPLWGNVPCTGPAVGAAHTPSYCTAVWTTTTTPTSGNIYCAVGTGNASDPATWNGTISLTSGVAQATFIGGTINFNGNGGTTFSPCVNGGGVTTCPAPANGLTNQLLFYATCCSPASASQTPLTFIDGGNATVSGDMFAPYGQATVTKNGTAAFTSFIEAYTVNVTTSGNMTGDGPPVNITGESSGDTLLQ